MRPALRARMAWLSNKCLQQWRKRTLRVADRNRAMKLYSSFLIRCWLIHEPAHDERPIIDVEHIQTGGRTRVASLTEAERWMLDACRTARPAGGAAQAAAHERPDSE